MPDFPISEVRHPSKEILHIVRKHRAQLQQTAVIRITKIEYFNTNLLSNAYSIFAHLGTAAKIASI
jgi:hypothetical protein